MEKVLCYSTYGSIANHERTANNAMNIAQWSYRRGLDCNSTQSRLALGTAATLRVSTKGLICFLSDVLREVYRSLRRRTRTSPSPEPFVERKETSTERLLHILDSSTREKKMLTENQGLPTCSQHVEVVGTGLTVARKPSSATRIGIDRLSRTRVSQSRTMPRSNRVWRECKP